MLDDTLTEKLLARLTADSDQVVFFPVRHHSPTGARLLRSLIASLKPAAILIEGPADFNERLAELYLEHQLPIAIYSYCQLGMSSGPGGTTGQTEHRRLGAYYPFCEYSPEWQAILAGRPSGTQSDHASEESQAPYIEFIDLPWRVVAPLDQVGHRYADAEMRRGGYVEFLCERLGVDTFDELWDQLIEIDGSLTIGDYLENVHRFCLHMRCWDNAVPMSDQLREAYMTRRVQNAMEQKAGSILVVTGGYHSSAIAARLFNLACPGIERDFVFPEDLDSMEFECTWNSLIAEEVVATSIADPRAASDDGTSAEPGSDNKTSRDEVTDDAVSSDKVGTQDQQAAPQSQDVGPHFGLALTPYSYERLDGLSGYESGMPSPGFYSYVWEARSQDREVSHQELLTKVVRMLRERKQTASTADLIAVETMARGLAAVRGHEQEGRPLIWRNDLLDAVTSALVKEEVAWDAGSPFMQAVLAVFRGDRRGRLADDAPRSPLATDIERQLESHGLQLAPRRRELSLDLYEPEQRAQSRVLHRLKILEIAGFQRTGGSDFSAGESLEEVWESWRIHWSPDFDATCVEASRYGAGLEDAAASRLQEQAVDLERSAESAARLLVQTALAGIKSLNAELLGRLETLIRDEGDFLGASGAIEHLIYLFVFDEVLGTAHADTIGQLLREVFTRAVWLLESLGDPAGQLRETLGGIAHVLEAFERCETLLDLNREEFVAVLERIETQADQHAAVRGAAVGCLWSLQEADSTRVQQHLEAFTQPEQMGDYLSGLFYLAREVAQRHPELVRGIDAAVQAMSDEQFLNAVPALRMAFTWFTPREKHYMLSTLFESLGIRQSETLATLDVDEGTAARVMLFEGRLFEQARRFGIRGGEPSRISKEEQPQKPPTDKDTP